MGINSNFPTKYRINFKSNINLNEEKTLVEHDKGTCACFMWLKSILQRATKLNGVWINLENNKLIMYK